MGPAKTSSQKALRSAPLENLAFTFSLKLPAKAASLLIPDGNRLSSCVRIKRTKTGASPPLEIAI